MRAKEINFSENYKQETDELEKGLDKQYARLLFFTLNWFFRSADPPFCSPERLSELVKAIGSDGIVIEGIKHKFEIENGRLVLS